jgi:hypothetical protein
LGTIFAPWVFPKNRGLVKIALWTGKKPTKRTYEMICFYFIGWADEEELLAHLEKLKAQDTQAPFTSCVTGGVRCCALAAWRRSLLPTQATPNHRRELLASALLRRLAPTAIIEPNGIVPVPITSSS